MKELDLFNKEMIVRGYLREMTNTEKKYYKNFGEELSPQELRCYRIICNSGTELISSKEISEKIFGECKDLKIAVSNIQNVWILINRIKQKLGPSEIICKPWHGYMSRRSLIESTVKENLKEEVTERI